MRHCGTKRLETERLILRRFETGDAEKSAQTALKAVMTREIRIPEWS